MKKRFIAGAVCPQCRAEDRLQIHWLRLGEQTWEERHCVACGFADQAEESVRGTETLPRIRRGRQSGDAPSQPVRILDPKSPGG
ncbi:MAG: YheV family putative zinc ribbon protein [Pseudomonadota bacterium]